MEIIEWEFAGREKEALELQKILKTKRSSFTVVLGRRRIGKTCLIKEAYNKTFDFYLTGVQDGDLEVSLKVFTEQLQDYSKSLQPLAMPTNWLDAFTMLKVYLNDLKSQRKKVIFIDEFPWLDSHLSGFLPAFEYFWNSWAVDQNLVLVICGSASSWMLQHVRDNKGGLHNRVNKYIHLQPFTLHETAQFFKKRKISFDKIEIARLYMALGGIPFYLNEVKSGLSAVQNIDAILFDKQSPLQNEFQNLYRSLFKFHENYEKVIKALSTKNKGLTRNELIEHTSISVGGGITKVISELEANNFIRSYQPYGKTKRETLYQLTDEYSLFYFHFNLEKQKKGDFIKMQDTPKVHQWSGKAFEMLCLRHINAVKMALGISGMATSEFSFYFKGNPDDKGFQIDLIIDRNDQCINICEMKFSQSEYVFTKVEAEKLRQRKEGFRRISKTKKQIFITLITPFGLTHNQHSLGLINNVIVLKDLYKELAF